jgi:ketosteroid isomerase-like protein
MPPNNPALIGKKAIRDFWSQALQWGKWEFSFETQKVDARTDMAVERGKYILRFTAGEKAPPGMNSFEDRGNYLVHWRRENDGEWRAVADAPVSELPYPGKL